MMLRIDSRVTLFSDVAICVSFGPSRKLSAELSVMDCIVVVVLFLKVMISYLVKYAGKLVLVDVIAFAWERK